MARLHLVSLALTLSWQASVAADSEALREDQAARTQIIDAQALEALHGCGLHFTMSIFLLGTHVAMLFVCRAAGWPNVDIHNCDALH